MFLAAKAKVAALNGILIILQHIQHFAEFKRMTNPKLKDDISAVTINRWSREPTARPEGKPKLLFVSIKFIILLINILISAQANYSIFGFKLCI